MYAYMYMRIYIYIHTDTRTHGYVGLFRVSAPGGHDGLEMRQVRVEVNVEASSFRSLGVWGLGFTGLGFFG